MCYLVCFQELIIWLGIFYSLALGHMILVNILPFYKPNISVYVISLFQYYCTNSHNFLTTDVLPVL